jgi:hypothetical protein
MIKIWIKNIIIIRHFYQSFGYKTDDFLENQLMINFSLYINTISICSKNCLFFGKSVFLNNLQHWSNELFGASGYLSNEQGDWIGRLFAYWVIHYFGLVCLKFQK